MKILGSKFNYFYFLCCVQSSYSYFFLLEFVSVLAIYISQNCNFLYVPKRDTVISHSPILISLLIFYSYSKSIVKTEHST